MAQTLKTFENALKENYLPVWRNQLGIEPSVLLSKIKKVPLVSNKIVSSAEVGLSGGFGFGAEGMATPAAGAVKIERFETEARDMYVNIVLSTKAVRLTGNGGAMASALDTEVKASYKTASWNLGRSLFGNGSGVLTTISALGEAGNVITVADASKLKEGLIVDIYNADGTLQDTRRIVSINKTVSTITVAGEAKAFAEGFITVQNSYNREITGLGAIFDENVKTLYGLDKETHQFLYPTAIDAGADLDDSIINKALRTSKNDKNGDVDMILCGDEAFDHYVEYLRTNNHRVEEMTKTLNGGFKAIKYVFGNKEIDIVNESFVPSKEMWGVSTNDLELHMQEWNFADLQGGGIFNLMEGQSLYRALLANYGDLICKNPGGCLRIYNCCA